MIRATAWIAWALVAPAIFGWSRWPLGAMIVYVLSIGLFFLIGDRIQNTRLREGGLRAMAVLWAIWSLRFAWPIALAYAAGRGVRLISN